MTKYRLVAIGADGRETCLMTDLTAADAATLAARLRADCPKSAYRVDPNAPTPDRPPEDGR
jgi:hypothetical protein